MKLPFIWWPLLIALSAAILAMDYAAGPLIRFPITFILPVALAAWHFGLWPALGFAAVLTGFRSVLMARRASPSPTYAEINAAIQFAVLAASARFVRSVAQEQELARQVKVLEGLLPICMFCKRIRRTDGDWEQIEACIANRSAARFSHGICQACGHEHYPESFPEPDPSAGPAGSPSSVRTL